MNPPTGTVILVFTDIQGSSEAWRRHRDDFLPVLEAHNQLMREVAARWNGYEVKTEGDAFFLTFHKATDAIRFCVDAQIAIGKHPWPTLHSEVAELQVRMGVDTGEPISVVHPDGTLDYFGHIVNRAARIGGAGQGGQVIISDATCTLVHDALPSEITFLDLGNHDLKGVGIWKLWQVCHPELQRKFPASKFFATISHNLPRQLTSFIGREKDTAEVKRLLTASPLVTLTGAGGCGKTRLSLQVARAMLDEYPDGVWLVELASLTDPSLVAQRVAEVLGIKEQVGQPIQQTLTETLKTKSLLLVLDNCEHLLSACTNMAVVLFRASTNVKVLATSRELFGIFGEQTFRVPSLSCPTPNQMVTPEALIQYDGVRLFVERATQHRPNFSVTSANAGALAQICHRLDGIPIALELAAARIRSLSVEQINDRLDDRFPLLVGGDRSALPRQQTIQALIDWSFDLLTEKEKRLLSRLSVFAGGWTLEAAEHTCSSESAATASINNWDVLDSLTSLVDKSLVIADEQDGSMRYRLLETVKQYAAERLKANGEITQVKIRHRDYFLALADEAAPQLIGPKQQDWLERLESEHDNLRAGLNWCGGEEGAEAGLRLSGALWRFWYVRGHWSEGREHLERALARKEVQSSIILRAKALYGVGTVAALQGDYSTAQTLCGDGLRLYRELRDKSGMAWTLNQLGYVAYARGEYAAAQTQLEEGLTLFRELGDASGVAYVLNYLGLVASNQGYYKAARKQLEESLCLLKELRDKRGIAYALVHLGNIAANQRDYVTAWSELEASLILFKELGDKSGIARALVQQGNVYSGRGDYTAARIQFEDGLRLYREVGHKNGTAYALEKLASTFMKHAYGSYPARLWGAAAVVRESIGAPLPPNEYEEYDQQVLQARSTLGETAFTAAWEEGRAMTWEQAVEYALEEK